MIDSTIYDKIIIPIVIAIITALITAFLMRKNQRANWLLERRTDIFIKYLELVNSCFDKALEDVMKYESEKLHLETQTYFFKLKSYSKIVNLILYEKDKNKMEDLSSKLLIQMLKITKQTDNKNELSEIIDQISEIFENNLRRLNLR